MEAVESDDRKRLDRWLALLFPQGPTDARPEAIAERYKAQDGAIAEMRAAGADRLFPLLAPLLTDPDPEVRCRGCEVVLRVDARRALALVLPLLADPDWAVRVQACGCLHDFGDERAVPALAEVLRRDSDPQVRGTAAYALGGIGSAAAIPALLAVLGSDNEYDELGHSPSSCAAGALDDILGTNETRSRIRPGNPDLDLLQYLAVERFRQWSSGRAEPGAAADGGGTIAFPGS